MVINWRRNIGDKMTSSKELASKWANPSLLLRGLVFRKVEASDWWWAARDHGKGLPAFLCARERDIWVRGRANPVTGIRFAFCSNGKNQHGFQAEIPVRLLFRMGNFSSVTVIDKGRPFTYLHSRWMEKHSSTITQIPMGKLRPRLPSQPSYSILTLTRQNFYEGV